VKGNLGTPYYVSPEVLEEKAYDCRTDLWSLGIMIYFCIKGKQAYDAKNRKELKKLVLSVYIPDYSEMSFKYFQIISGLLYKDPEERISLDNVLGLLNS